MTKLEPLSAETERFLAQFKPHTRMAYRSRIKAFAKDTGISDVLVWIRDTESRELKAYIQTYYNKQIEKKEKINSVLLTVTALRSIATEFDKTIKFRKGALDKIEEDQNSYEVTSSDLARLFEVADLTERAILATAASLGYDISSFLALDRQKVRALVERAISEREEWASWVDNRKKTSAKRLNVLNPLAVKYLKLYFDAGLKNNSERLFPYAESGISTMLRRLFEKASIDAAGQKIRFHSVRKWLMTKLNEAGLSVYSVKLILGKEIDVADSTYLNHLEQTALADYKRVYEQYLTFTNGKGNGLVKKDLEEQKSKVAALEKQLVETRELMYKRLDTMEYFFNEMMNLPEQERLKRFKEIAKEAETFSERMAERRKQGHYEGYDNSKQEGKMA